MIKSVTDYGVLMELFIGVLVDKDRELAHKSFIKKITNRLDRYHKRRQNQCAMSEDKVKNAIVIVETATRSEGSTEISLGALCWIVYNKHKEELKPYNFDKRAFEDMNRYFNAQGVIMQTAKVVRRIEEAMDDK